MRNIVELHVTGSSCSANCEHCNLSGKTNKPNVMNNNVRQSFEVVQDLLNVFQLRRKLGYPYPLNGQVVEQLPKIKQPKLIETISIGNGKLDNKIPVHMAVEKAITNLTFILEDFSKENVKQKIGSRLAIGQSIGGIFLEKYGEEFIDQFFTEFQAYIKANKYSEGIIGMSNNMVDKTQGDITSKAIEKELIQEQTRLKDIYIRNISGKNKVISERSIFDKYLSEEYTCTSVKYGSTITEGTGINYSFLKRLLSKTEKMNLENSRNSALGCLTEKDAAGIAIFPHGILMQHSSMDIHNGFLWVSHERFEKKCKKFTGKMLSTLIKFTNKFNGHQEKILGIIINHLITENINEYDRLGKFNKEQERLVGQAKKGYKAA